MRYYDLTVSSIKTGEVIRHWQTHPQGATAAPDPGALNIEFDLLLSPYAIATGDQTGGGDYGNSFIRVWGVPLQDIAQAANLSAPSAAPGPTYKVVLRGGMAKGLPLANPAQIGVIVQGYIWRAIGNWIGLNMTLDLYLTAMPATAEAIAANLPKLPVNNFTFYAPQGASLASAINTTLRAAFPGVPISIGINPALVAPYALIDIKGTLQSFSDYLNKQSVALLGAANPGYQGVQIFARDGGLVVTDGSTSTASQATGGAKAPAFKTVQVAFTDLIGQPTWIGNNTIQVTTVMRGDIQIADKVTLPPTLTTIGAAGAINTPSETFTQARWTSQFQGTFTVQELRQVGNYKADQATGWVTMFTAVQTPGPTAIAAPPSPSSPAKTPEPLP